MGKPYIDFVGVKSAVSIIQVLDRYGLLGQMRSIRGGDGYEGRCPIHKGTSANQFKVSVSKNCWNCFSNECARGGNVLDFVARMENVDVHGAAMRLNEWFRLGLEKQPRSLPEDQMPQTPTAHRKQRRPSEAQTTQTPPQREGKAEGE